MPRLQAASGLVAGLIKLLTKFVEGSRNSKCSILLRFDQFIMFITGRTKIALSGESESEKEGDRSILDVFEAT